MKIIRISAIILTVTMLFGLNTFLPTVTRAADTVNVTVNGKEVVFSELQPFTDNGRTQVPIQFAETELGCDLWFDKDTSKVTISKDGVDISFVEQSNNNTTNAASKSLDKQMPVPLRHLAETCGYEVAWDAKTSTVVITDSGENICKLGDISVGLEDGDNVVIDSTEVVINKRSGLILEGESDKEILQIRIDIDNFGANIPTQLAETEALLRQCFSEEQAEQMDSIMAHLADIIATSDITQPKTWYVDGYEITISCEDGVISITILPVLSSSSPKPVNIPAWVLTQDVAIKGLSSYAFLEKTIGDWAENAKGRLSINDESAEHIYNNFAVSNNPVVNEKSHYITRRPNVTATLSRADFGDDPQNGSYATNGALLSKTGKITGSGSVSRQYKWITSQKDRYGEVTYEEHEGTATADFEKVAFQQTYTFDVYNGISTLPYKKAFQSKADKTTIKNNGLSYDLAWEGTPISFDVVRWMCHRNADNVESGWKAIDGRYERKFIGQSTGSMTWKTEKSQASGYQKDRSNARVGKTGQKNYSVAVFATDKNLQSIGYPIKSGYYFNPLGIYTCTVKTQQYKDENKSSEEHRNLVENVKSAFRYSSDLHYVTASRDITRLTNVSNDQNRAVLKVETKTTPLNAKKLKTSTSRDGDVDTLLKEVMEGYNESSSYNSWTQYKYQEKTSKTIYLIEEETVITFTLAPLNTINMYTHVNMPNGDYSIRVWAEKFTFEGVSEKRANLAIENSGFFDGLKVTVRGSMYDDR